MSSPHLTQLHTYLNNFAITALEGNGDSDRHLLSLFAIALASKGKTYVELGVRNGDTVLPLLTAAAVNGGELFSVDIQKTGFKCPKELEKFWHFKKCDSLLFLKKWPKDRKIDFVLVDDWHAYGHVKKELEYLDAYIGPSSIIVLHDLMYGHAAPFYHSDLTLKKGQWAGGGPYRAVAELDPQFWEWATLPWGHGLTFLRKKYSNKYHPA